MNQRERALEIARYVVNADALVGVYGLDALDVARAVLDAEEEFNRAKERHAEALDIVRGVDERVPGTKAQVDRLKEQARALLAKEGPERRRGGDGTEC